MDCGLKIARFLLITFNILFWLSGVVILGVGIWLSVDESLLDLVDFIALDETDPLFKYAAYVLIGVGAFVFVVGFVGCFGALKGNKFMLGLYIFMLVLVLIGELAAGIMAFMHKKRIDEEFKEQWNSKLANDMYANMTKDPVEYTAFGASMDIVQWKFRCCGVKGPEDYMNNHTEWPKTDISGTERPFPFTCCRLEKGIKDARHVQPDNVLDLQLCYSIVPDYIWEKGCYRSLMDWFGKYAVILGGVGIGIAGLEIFGFLFACCLYRAVEKDDDYS